MATRPCGGSATVFADVFQEHSNYFCDRVLRVRGDGVAGFFDQYEIADSDVDSVFVQSGYRQ